MNTANMREQREVRKVRFIQTFNQSPSYQKLRERLKKALFRVAIEKYKKKVSNNGLQKEDREKFKAEMYTYIRE
mgnify:CR=1 FL=1